MPSGSPSSGRALPLRQPRVARLGLSQRPLRRRQHVGVEMRVAGLDGAEERLRQLGGGELLLCEPLARLGQRQFGELGHSLDRSRRQPAMSGSDASLHASELALTRLTPGSSHSTTFGTTKKWSSRAGALATMSSAMPPSVTRSSRIFKRRRHHRRHRLDARGVDLVELLDPIEDAGQLALQRLGLRVGDLDARQPRDAPHRRLVDLHGSSIPLACCKMALHS